jgi:folate-binding protein YgfZ
MTDFAAALIPLPQISVLKVAGPDATGFLQAQLSRRVDSLSPSSSALAGWHDARGRVRVVFRVLPSDGGYLLLMPNELVDQILPALKMFVLRADVHVELTSLVCGGLLAGDRDAPTQAWLPKELNALATSGDVTAICIAPGCWHVVGTGEHSKEQPMSDSAAVVAAEIRAGLPQVDQRTTLRYVPHMLNLDKLGALDFSKGCYPGQEIIARTEHLGSVKRRARAFMVNAQTPHTDTPAVDSPMVNSNNERIGEVLRAARSADGSIVLLAVVALSALDNDIFLDSPRGAQLSRLTLPFE